MPRVFVVNEPLRMDGSRSFDLSPARQFGELVFLLPPGKLPADLSVSLNSLRQGLASMQTNDYLLAVGDLRAIAWASAIAAHRCGGVLRLLHWSRGAYVCHTAQLYTREPANT